MKFIAHHSLFAIRLFCVSLILHSSFFILNFIHAQEPARANVAAYYDENAIEKLAYRESPYYMELTGSWKQQRTDSSVIYSRQIEAEKSWKDYHVYLNVRCGHGVRVRLNGKEMGRAGDSRHWNEFLLAGFKYGSSNTLTIEALKHTQEALLEDASLGVGLNGEPYLLFKNDPNIADLSLVADYDAATSTGTLTVTADIFCGKKKGKYYLEVVLWDAHGREFDRMGRWAVFNGRNEESVDLSRSWTSVEPWTAETPVLYTAVVRLRNEKMEEEELVGARFGFRSVEVKDGLLQVNGRPVTLRGIIYGIEHTEGYASREQMRRDVIEMKRHNINAVRTARFSPMEPWFYELCDKYGLYVVCDANLLPLSEKRMAVATDKEYMPLFQQRVEHLYGKYKNHTSIIAWSLGNTRDNGVCMNVAYSWLKALDKTRPVIFSGADFSDATDIIAPVYPTVQTLKQSLKKQGSRPLLMFASVDASRFANLEDLWQLVSDRRQLQGGFVDVWPMTSTMLSDLRQLYSPFEVSFLKTTPDEGEFLVTNRNDFANFSRYVLDYNVYTNLQSNITGGDLPVALQAGGSDKVSMRLPQMTLQPGEEAFIQFNLRLRNSDPLIGGSREVGTRVFSLPFRTTVAQPRNGSPSTALPQGMDTLLPSLYFVGHEDWQVKDSGDIRMYYTADGIFKCIVRRTVTAFGDDIVIDYTFLTADRSLDGKLQPAFRVLHDGDSVCWFGLDREVCFRQHNSARVGIHHAALGKPLSRGEVRWCAASRAGEGLFMELLGQRCSYTADGQYFCLKPQASDSLRLHLRRYGVGDKPAAFAGRKFPSSVSAPLELPVVTSTQRPSYEYIVSTTFSRKANTPYNVGADTILFDGQKGEIDNLVQHWLGFSGPAVTSTIQFAKGLSLEYLVLRYAHDPASWIFAPIQVSVVVDGDTIVQTLPFSPDDEEEATPRVVEVRVPIRHDNVTVLQIIPQTLSVIPEWHRGKGLKPWMLMDEIEIIEK